MRLSLPLRRSSDRPCILFAPPPASHLAAAAHCLSTVVAGLVSLPLVPAKAGTQHWIPACAGTGGVCCARRISHCFNCQTAKHHRPVSLRRRVRRHPPARGRRLSVPLEPDRGDGAPSGAPVFRSRALSRERGRLSALHRGFSVPGAVLPCAGEGHSPDPDPAGFRLPSPAPRPAIKGGPP